MAIQNFCATHWGAREPQSIQPEVAEPVDGTPCDFCGKPAARAAGHEPEPVPRGHLADGARYGWKDASEAALASDVLPAEKLVAETRMPSLRPSKAPKGE